MYPSSVVLLTVLIAGGAYFFVGGLVADWRGWQYKPWYFYVFWPYFLVAPPVRSLWQQLRAPKPPNRVT